MIIMRNQINVLGIIQVNPVSIIKDPDIIRKPPNTIPTIIPPHYQMKNLNSKEKSAVNMINMTFTRKNHPLTINSR